MCQTGRLNWDFYLINRPWEQKLLCPAWIWLSLVNGLKWWQLVTWLLSDVFKVNALMSLHTTARVFTFIASNITLIHMIVLPTCSSLKVVPVGMSRGVKKLMQERFPNMSKFEDISELLMKWGSSERTIVVVAQLAGSFRIFGFVFSQGGEPFRKWSRARWRAQHHWAATGILRPRQHGVPAECCPSDWGEWAEEAILWITMWQ